MLSIRLVILYLKPTKTTPDMSAGGSKVFVKNPAQHYADLHMLIRTPVSKPVFFFKSNLSVKDIQCVRVDGSNDEGPSHEEVMFWWTTRHLEQVALLTTHASGSKYQNGCLALGHANLFIPFTLGGSVSNEILTWIK